MLTQAQVRDLFDYREGQLYWKVNTGTKKLIGKVAGNINRNGYGEIGIHKISYTLHRVIFLYHHGYLPIVVDHINGINTDNRIENLRGCSHSQNLKNQGRRKSAKNKYKGVAFHVRRQSYLVRIWVDYKCIYLGWHINQEIGAQIYNEAALKYHGEFARLNVIRESA